MASLRLGAATGAGGGHAASPTAVTCPSSPSTRVPGGSGRRRQLHSGARLEQHAPGRCEPPGEGGHPQRVVEQQPGPGVRQQHQVAHHAQAAAVHLRVTGAVRRAVTEQHDPVRQGHRARGPRDHRRPQDRRHVEQVQHLGQHPDVAARHDQRGRRTQHARHVRAVPGDRRPVVRPQPGIELAADLVDPQQMRSVEFAHRRHRLGARPIHRRARGPALQRVHRLQRIVQPQQVEVLQFGEYARHRALGRRVLRVPLLHVQPPPVQPQPHAPPAQPRVQLAVVALALLPPGRHRGERPRQAQRPHHRVHRRPALRTQQDDPHDA